MTISVAQALRMDVLRQCRVLAGAQRLDRPVEHVNVLETFIEGDEKISVRNHLLLTTFAFTGNDAARQTFMIDLMARSGCAAILFQEGVVAPLSMPVIARAEQLGLPLIEVPGTVLYHEIIEPLAVALLQDDSYRLHHALAVHRRLAEAAIEAADLSALLGAVAALLNRAVSVVGRIEGLLGASADWVAGDAPSIADLMPLKTQTRLKFGWAVPLRGAEWLLVAARGPDDVLTPLDSTTLRESSGAVALEVYRLRSLHEAGSREREELVQSLLATSRASEADDLAGRMFRLGWAVGPRSRVLRIAVEPTSAAVAEAAPVADEAFLNARERALRVLMDGLAAADARAPLALFRSGVAYVPQDGDTGSALQDALRKRLLPVVSRVSDVVPGWHCRVGVGGIDDDGIDLSASLAQADKALNLSANLRELGWFVEYEQVALPSLLLELSQRRDVQRWQTRTLGPLLDVNAQRADLVRTLDVFLDTGDSHKQTARILDVHPKTLKYRLDRISDLLGESAFNAERRLSLHLAVKLSRLGGPRG
jgi:PucR family transcriptional regulator, purine catabolism regulatory protein